MRSYRAIKEHVCDGCNNRIEAGTVYFTVTQERRSYDMKRYKKLCDNCARDINPQYVRDTYYYMQRGKAYAREQTRA